MLEMALIFPLVTVLIFGAIDFGFVLSDSSTVQQAARETARAATVHNYGTDTTCPIVGVAPPTDTAALICFAKERAGLDAAQTRVKIVLGTGGDAKGEPIAVCIQYPRASRTGVLSFMFSDRVVSGGITMRLEGDGSLTSAEETALDPAGWPDCTL
jgi:Flp pilus assembly protein TadG